MLKAVLKVVWARCFWGLSASSPVKKTPDESAEPQDSAEPASSSQESLLHATDASKDAPKLDPDAWIQVEKRHRQPSGKAKVEKLNLRVLASYFHPFLPAFSFCVSPHFILLTSSILPVHLSCCSSPSVSSTLPPAACRWWCVCCQFLSSLSAPTWTWTPPLCSWVLSCSHLLITSSPSVVPPTFLIQFSHFIPSYLTFPTIRSCNSNYTRIVCQFRHFGLNFRCFQSKHKYFTLVGKLLMHLQQRSG